MPGNRQLQRYLRMALYHLKRNYGGRIDLYKLLSSDTDSRTGDAVQVKEAYPIDRAIILPATLSREERRGIALISSNKLLTQGGYFDSVDCTFIIEREDAPGLEITPDDWIVESGRKYQIVNVDEYEVDSAWVIRAKALVGEVPQQIHVLYAENFLSISSAGAKGE